MDNKKPLQKNVEQPVAPLAPQAWNGAQIVLADKCLFHRFCSNMPVNF